MKRLAVIGSHTFCFVGCLSAAIWRGREMDLFSWACVALTGLCFLDALCVAIIESRPVPPTGNIGCRILGHARPVYHETRAFWWCPRCHLALGLNSRAWEADALIANARRRELGEFDSEDNLPGGR